MTKIYEVELVGASPLLMHGAQAVGMDDESSKRKGGNAINGDPEEWRKTIYFDPAIGVVMPMGNLEASLVEAAKMHKVTGRQTATKYFKSGVFAEAPEVPLIVNGKPIKTLDEIEKNPEKYIDKRGVKNPATKMRNTRYRVKFGNWAIRFRLIVSSDDFISEKILREVIETAGRVVGVCDFRPRFGRFEIKTLKVVA